MFPEHPVDRVGVHVPAALLPFAIVTNRAEQRSVDILGVAGCVEISADTLRDAWMARLSRLPPLRTTQSESKLRF